MSYNNIIIIALLIGLFSPTLFAQNVGIGTNTPHASAKLHISDSNKGLLIPNVSIGDIGAAAPVTAPADGLLVWNTNPATIGGGGIGYYYWDGTQWRMLSISSGTDDQNLTGATLVGTNLTIDIENGASTSVNLAGLVNDADAVIGNEYNTNLTLTGTNLNVIDGGGTLTVDLASLRRIAENGLYVNAGNNAIRLGGPLIETTTITNGVHSLIFNLDNTGDFLVRDAGINRFAVLDNGRTTIGGTANAGMFNVTGNSYFSDDIYLRDGAVNTGDILVRIYDSADDGIIDVYEDNAYNHRIHGNGTTIFNEQGNNNDFRIEGDADPNIFFVDASTDYIGIGLATPANKLHVEANASGANQSVIYARNTNNGAGVSYGARGEVNSTAIGSAGVLGFSTNGGQNEIGTAGDYTLWGAGVFGLGWSADYNDMQSSRDFGVYGVCDFSTGTGVYGEDINNSAGSFAVYAEGKFATTGTKSASVPTSKGNQLVYCMESPEIWFEDMGVGQLVNGEVHIQLDKMFHETVFIDAEHPMHVFLQEQGDCNGLFFIPDADGKGFTVKEKAGGTSNVKFSFRVMGKRRFYQDHRFGVDSHRPFEDNLKNAKYVAPYPTDPVEMKNLVEKATREKEALFKEMQTKKEK